MADRWLKTAPLRLVAACKNGEVRNGSAILRRLLTDVRMNSAWKALSNKVTTNDQWMDIWRAVAYAKFKSNQTKRAVKRRSDERDSFRKLSEDFGRLAKKIENGKMDVLAYHLLPADVLAALHVPDFKELHPLEQSSVAHRLLPEWPVASELLRGMEDLALRLANDAMDTPRASSRRSARYVERVFVCHLGKEFQSIFGQSLLGTLATITNVVYELSDKEERGKNWAQDALKTGV